MATILSFGAYHFPISDQSLPLFLLRYSPIPTPYLGSVSSGCRYRRIQFSVSASRDRKVEEKISADRRAGTLAGGRRNLGMEVRKQVEKGLASEDGVVDFEWKWPLWKELPMRYKLIGTTSLAFVVNLSVAIIPMSHQFGWNSSTAGLVQSSFFWGYALSQLPGGWLAKLFGGRKVLEVGVLSWSLATILVPNSAGFMPGLVLSRILIYSITRTLQSSCICFWRLLFAPPIIQACGWESVFYIFGILGIIWCLAFKFVKEAQPPLDADYFDFRERPMDVVDHIVVSEPEEKSRSSSFEELSNSLQDVPWRAFFRSRAVWAMVYAHFCGSWGHYTCLSWLPTYFGEELGLNLTEAAWVSILPPLGSIMVTSIAALFADNLISNGVETTTVRKICQTIAFSSPAICMTLSSLDLGLPPWEVVGVLTCGLYCTHQDISPEYASILLGITNTVGAVPGIVGVALTGYLLDSTHSWGLSLFAPSIFFYLTGTVVWLLFASSKPQNFT
ncbi:hypothetical protein M5K25_015681 [Dendrobium thyrsiflorum]|uniref:Major facilitator superfamily (MFS) profile domain-containing protein n=1 Tax=Dendrobium thyrsiflorum TaxID=117978 RepID=A0ABD0UXS6_DENTH